MYFHYICPIYNTDMHTQVRYPNIANTQYKTICQSLQFTGNIQIQLLAESCSLVQCLQTKAFVYVLCATAIIKCCLYVCCYQNVTNGNKWILYCIVLYCIDNALVVIMHLYRLPTCGHGRFKY